MKTLRIFLGPAIVSDTLDSLVGAVHDAENGRMSRELQVAVLGLHKKLENGKGIVFELTPAEAEYLARELNYCADRNSDYEPALAYRMQKKEEQIRAMLKAV